MVSVEWSAVMVQQVTVDGWMRGGPVGEESCGVGVQRDVTVVVELADRDPQPWRRVEVDDRVGGEAAELTDPHPGPGQQLDDEPIERRSDGGLRRRGGRLGRRLRTRAAGHRRRGHRPRRSACGRVRRSSPTR